MDTAHYKHIRNLAKKFCTVPSVENLASTEGEVMGRCVQSITADSRFRRAQLTNLCDISNKHNAGPFPHLQILSLSLLLL